MTSKEARLRKRLDDLENELKTLECRVRSKPRPLQCDLATGNWTSANVHIGGTCTKANAPKLEGSKKKKGPWEDKNVLPTKDDCWTFLRNINRNIAKGSEAISKIASLTEISSLSGKGDFLKPVEYDICGVNNKHVLNKPTKTRFKKNSDDTNQSLLEKRMKKLRFSHTLLEQSSPPPTKDKNLSSEVEELKHDMEERLLDLKILGEKIENVKKKLRGERTRREIAEKALAGYKRRLAILEGKKAKEENVDGTVSHSSTKQENIPSAELELKSEIKKRITAEKRIQELMTALEESRNEILKTEENRRLALAMADKFREQRCQHSPHELEKLRGEKAVLEKEIEEMQERAEAVLAEKLAERTEQELIDKMKQCHAFILKNSINDPDVQDVIRHYKEAYGELQLEIERRDAELHNLRATFDKHLEETKTLAANKYRELNEKYVAAISALQEMEVSGKKVHDEATSRFEETIAGLNKQLENITKVKSKLEKEIKNLKKNSLADKEEINKLEKAYEERADLHGCLEKKYNDLLDTLKQRDLTLESLRMEMEKEKDVIKIKEKILQDQVDTIKCLRTVADNTKKTLDDERGQKQKLMEDMDKLKLSQEMLERKLRGLQKQLRENEENQLSLIKSNEALKSQESKVSTQQEALLNQLAQIKYEKDQAIQTARFATEKLVQAVNEYELKLAAQKNLQIVLNESLKEKNFQLGVANQQINELNEELWKSARISSQIRNDLQSKLRKACEVCTDMLDFQFESEP